MNLMKIGNRIYNVGMMVEADFTPAKEEQSQETGAPISTPAKLNICFAAPETEARTDHNGDYIGEEVSLYNRLLHGAEAEKTWATLNAMLHNNEGCRLY